MKREKNASNASMAGGVLSLYDLLIPLSSGGFCNLSTAHDYKSDRTKTEMARLLARKSLQSRLGSCIALIGCLTVPRHGFIVALGDALANLVHRAEAEL